MKVVTLFGTRPEIIRVSAVMRTQRHAVQFNPRRVGADMLQLYRRVLRLQEGETPVPGLESAR